MKKRHWLAGNGEYGCLFDNLAVLPTKRAAIAYLADLFDEVPGVASTLRKYQYCDIGNRHGADYCEIIPCDCEDTETHEGI